MSATTITREDTAMEYRATIEIPGFPPTPENELGFALLEWLSDHTRMGPVMAGGVDATGATVTLSTDEPDEATAVRTMIDATSRALIAVGLGHLYPSHVELELT